MRIVGLGILGAIQLAFWFKAFGVVAGELIIRHGTPVPPIVIAGAGLLALGLIPVLAMQAPSPEIAADPATPLIRLIAFAYVGCLGLAFLVTAWGQGRNLGQW